MHRLALLVALSFASCVTPRDPQAPPERTVLAADRVELPSTWLDEYAFVDVLVEGRGPYRFLVDTGATATAISTRVASRLPPRRHGGTVSVRGAHGTVTDSHLLLNIDKLEIDGCAFVDLGAVVIDLDPVSDMMGRRLDGILGYPLFRDCVLTIDYPGRRIELSATPLVPSADGPLLPLFGDNTPQIDLRFGEREHRFMIDSGSGGAFDLTGDGKDLRFSQGPKAASMSGSVSGLIALKPIGRLADDAHLGSIRIPEPIATFENDSQRFGTQVLRHFAVSFDQRQQCIRFTRSDERPIRFDAVRGTGAFFTPNADRWEVSVVLPGSPAENVGIRPGDQVIAINGQRVSESQFVSFSDLTSRSKVNFTLDRPVGAVIVTVPVTDLIP